MPPVALQPEHLLPIEDRIIVEPDSAADQTESGLFIPEVAKELPTWGTVRCVGPGRMLETGERAPLGFTVGDRVFYGRYSGMPVQVGGVDLLIIRATDIFAKLAPLG